MPYREHMACKPPESPDQAIWRYLTLPKFLYILEREALPFVRLDKMPDRFEGAPSQAAVDASLMYRPDLAMTREEWIRLAQDSYLANQFFTYASCWHQNNHESGAMWAQYSEEGIAIKTTFQRLVDSMKDDDHPITAGVVEYQNNSTEFGLGNTIVHAFRKRRYYEYEREVRAVVLVMPPDKAGPTFADSLKAAKTAPVAIDINADVRILIQEVYVSPGRPPWFHQLVADLLRRYNLRLTPTISYLDKQPRYS